MGTELSTEEVHRLFEVADTNGDGSVVNEELSALLTRCHEDGDFDKWAMDACMAPQPPVPTHSVRHAPNGAPWVMHPMCPAPKPFISTHPPTCLCRLARHLPVHPPAFPPVHPLTHRSTHPPACLCRLMRRCPVDGAQLLPGQDLANLIYVRLALDQGTGESLRVCALRGGAEGQLPGPCGGPGAGRGGTGGSLPACLPACLPAGACAVRCACAQSSLLTELALAELWWGLAARAYAFPFGVLSRCWQALPFVRASGPGLGGTQGPPPPHPICPHPPHPTTPHPPSA